MKNIFIYVVLVILLFTVFSFGDSEVSTVIDLGISPFNCDAPYAMCYDETNDCIWAIDAYNLNTPIRILQVSTDGTLLNSWENTNVQGATGMAYDHSNDLLVILIGGLTSTNQIIRVDITGDPTGIYDVLTTNIPFNFPIDLYWDDSGENYLWCSKNDTFGTRYVRRISYPGAVWDSELPVDYTKYPSGIMCDGSYIYVQGDRNGIIYRYDKATGDREDLPGVYPMASPFEVGEGNSFAANIEFSSDHSTEDGYFWILSWYNKKIYEVYYWDSDITNKSLGSIKALFE